MAEQPSETYSDEYVETLETNLNWHAAILAVLLQEAGGVVQVSAQELTKIDLTKARASISYDPENEVYIIEGLYTENES